MTLATSSAMQGLIFRSACLLMAPIMRMSSCSGFMFMVMGVTMVPGQTALQRMYLSAQSRAVCLVMPMMALLVDT